MAKQFIRKIEERVNLYWDPVTGIAWIEDYATGADFYSHSFAFIENNCVKKKDFWGENDRIVQVRDMIFNIDAPVCAEDEDGFSDYFAILANECKCAACQERRIRKEG